MSNETSTLSELSDKELDDRIEQQKEYIWCKEMSDDFYYTKGSYFADKRYLNELEAEKRKREEQKNEGAKQEV